MKNFISLRIERSSTVASIAKGSLNKTRINSNISLHDKYIFHWNFCFRFYAFGSSSCSFFFTHFAGSLTVAHELFTRNIFQHYFVFNFNVNDLIFLLIFFSPRNLYLSPLSCSFYCCCFFSICVTVWAGHNPLTHSTQ